MTKELYQYLHDHMNGMCGDFCLAVSDVSEVAPDAIIVSISNGTDGMSFYLYPDGKIEPAE